MLRDHSQHNGRKLSAAAAAAAEGHVLLLPASPRPIAGDGTGPAVRQNLRPPA
jgi:hypothetical protein